tara:strand:- start:2175 stop:2690 length:516 start_codon:yes stop_codon:yes gene_type:complete
MKSIRAAGAATSATTVEETSLTTPMAAAVVRAVMVVAAEPAEMAAGDVVTTKAVITAQVDLAGVVVPMAPTAPVEAPMLDQVARAAGAVLAEQAEPAETAGTGARTVEVAPLETRARLEAPVTQVLTGTALVDLVVLLAKVAQVAAADLVVAHAAPTSPIVDHSLSLTTAL